MYTEDDVKQFKVWRHLKTNGLYYVFGISICSTNGEKDGVERVVVYFSMTYQIVYHREISEFLDGRFTPVERMRK